MIHNMFKGIPLTVNQLHGLEYATRSGHYWTSFDGILNLKTPTNWQHQLSLDEIALIEHICTSGMAHLGYTLSYTTTDNS